MNDVETREYTVKNLAEIAGITVRTLHHYDKIGLLKPHHKSSSGYRIYTENELDKLQQILFFRELEFSLDEVKEILESPDYDRVEALEMHKKLLTKEKLRIEALIQTLNRCVEDEKGGKQMKSNEKFIGLDKSQLEAYREEAKERWGTEVVEASEARLDKQGINDPEQLQKQLNLILSSIAENMDKGLENSDVQEGVSELRKYMNQFYDCTDEIFVGLADMYLNDEKFYNNMSVYGEGFVEFLADAMKKSI